MGGRESEARFDALVEEALAGIPAPFRPYLENVQVLSEPAPAPALCRELGLGPGEGLYGLYQGVPRTERTADEPLYPDRVILYREPLLRDFGRDPAALRRQVALTVIHEIGHHFGLDEETLAALEEE